MARDIDLKETHTGMLIYRAKSGVPEDEVIAYCEGTILPWLRQKGVTSADFYNVSVSGVLMLAVCLDNYEADWRGIKNIGDFFELDHDGNQVKIVKKRNLVISSSGTSSNGRPSVRNARKKSRKK